MQAIVRHGAVVLLRCLSYFKGGGAKLCLRLAFTTGFLCLNNAWPIFA